MIDKIEYYTIEPDPDGGFWLVAHGEYGRGSVLEGQHMRQLVTHYDTAEAAQAANPGAEILDHSTRNPWAGTSLPDTPPDWFDPLDAGEEW